MEVASRTWPGINKEGGVARVIDVHYNNDGNTDTSLNKIQHPTHITSSTWSENQKKTCSCSVRQTCPQYEDHRSSQMISSTSLTTTTATTTTAEASLSRKSLRDRSILLGRCGAL